jgi:Hemolysins and related proteins containing CBS domains
MDDPEGTSTLLQILLLLVLTSINAFFAATEMAIVSINKNKLHILVEENNKKAKKVEQLLKEPTKFLSTIQVAITISNFFASASAATGISKQLGEMLTGLRIPYGTTLAFAGVTIILSFITLVFGELVPKRVALQNAEKFSMGAVGVVNGVSKVAAPFIKLLSVSTALVLRIMGKHDENLEERVSEEEIRSMIEVGQENGVFQQHEKEMIESIFEFDDKLADEIMTSRTDVYAIDINLPLSNYIDEMIETRHSRIPVYEENIDDIVGILYIKDFLLEARKVGFENVDVRTLIHKPYFIPETKPINDLFKELQESRQYIAILIDEYGGFSGIVTMEDIVEEVMGAIDDQGDEEEPKIEKVSEGVYMLYDLVTVSELNSKLGLDISSEQHDTVSGFLLDYMGRIPDDDEKCEVVWNNLTFKIEEIREKRIEKICLHIAKVDEVVSEEEL